MRMPMLTSAMLTSVLEPNGTTWNTLRCSTCNIASSTHRQWWPHSTETYHSNYH